MSFFEFTYKYQSQTSFTYTFFNTYWVLMEWTFAYHLINAHYIHLFFKTIKIGGHDAWAFITLIVTSIVIYSIIDLLFIIYFKKSFNLFTFVVFIHTFNFLMHYFF